jgi:hypothetical protein
MGTNEQQAGGVQPGLEASQLGRSPLGESRGGQRIILSEDLPLTLLTAVAAAVVVTALGLDRQFALLGVVVAPLAADLVKNAVVTRGWGKRRILGLTALLAFLGSARDALAGTRTRATVARPQRPRSLSGVVATAALSSAFAVALVTSSELAHGKALAAGRPTTFFSATAAAVPVPADVTNPEVTNPGDTNPEGPNPDASHPGIRLALPKGIELEAEGPRGARLRFDVDAVDRRGRHRSVTCDPAEGTLVPIGVTTVRCRTSSLAGDIEAGSFKAAVQDTTKPRLVMPPDLMTTSSDEAGKRLRFRAVAQDAVDGDVPVTCRPQSGSLFPRGKTTVTCTATDRAGNNETASLVVQIDPRDGKTDTQPPVLELANLEREAASGAGVRVEFVALAKDAVDGDIAASCRPRSGSLFALGETTVRCMARDTAGNTSRSTLIVMVVDTASPSLRLPHDLTLEGTSAAGAAATFEAGGVDTVSGRLTPSCTPASGDVFALGTTLVRCSVVDRAGNRRKGSFRIAVVDTTPPEITTRGDQTVEAESAKGATVAYSASAVDIVDGTLQPSCSPPPGLFALTTTAVTCSAVDAHGNRATAAFRITVADRTPPVFDSPPNVTAEAESSRGADVSYTVRAVDSVSGTVRHSCTPAAGALFPIGTTTVTCTAVDAQGNRSQSQFPVTVRDTTGPVLRLPPDFTVNAAFDEQRKTWGYTLDHRVTAVDRVDGSVPYRCKPSSGTFVAVQAGDTRKVTVSCTASDTRGNQTSAAFTITIKGPDMIR